MATVIFPWRGGCEHRERAFEWVRLRYEAEHPDWALVTAIGGDPWIKAKATMPAIVDCPDGVVIVADADCWCDGIAEAVQAVEEGAGWAMPHAGVFRLSEQGTAEYLAGAPYEGLELDRAPYRGVLGGGIVVSTREAMLTAPLDPRFVGWGQEDVSWSCALDTLAGERWRGRAALIHLWHPPQKRMSLKRGSEAGWALYRRYVHANGDAVKMRRLIEEFSDGDRRPDDKPLHDPAPV